MMTKLPKAVFPVAGFGRHFNLRRSNTEPLEQNGRYGKCVAAVSEFFDAVKKTECRRYTPSPAEAEFDGLTAGFETIQLRP